jgi:hypothetical protein
MGIELTYLDITCILSIPTELEIILHPLADRYLAVLGALPNRMGKLLLS